MQPAVVQKQKHSDSSTKKNTKKYLTDEGWSRKEATQKYTTCK